MGEEGRRAVRFGPDILSHYVGVSSHLKEGKGEKKSQAFSHS